MNPPHLADSKGQLFPGALIPFCAYNQEMSILGRNLTQLTLPVCDKFKPVVRYGGICYALDMADLSWQIKGETRPGSDFGIWLVINTEMSSTENFFVPKEFGINEKAQKSKSVTVHLSSLQEFTDVRSGVYGLTSLKKLTGTETFLGLPDEVKECHVGDYDTCRNDNFIEKVKKKCGCVPWSLADRYKTEKICSPTALSCVSTIETTTNHCQKSCTGLHAVVWHMDNTKDDNFWQSFGMMEMEYTRYLNNYAENSMYNSSAKTLGKKILYQ